jgi:hypothetical protein
MLSCSTHLISEEETMVSTSNRLTVRFDLWSPCQVSRLREYQGVDPHFDVIARQYHEIVKVTLTPLTTICHFLMYLLVTWFELQKLEGMQWTIHQVEMDLKPASSWSCGRLNPITLGEEASCVCYHSPECSGHGFVEFVVCRSGSQDRETE